MMRPMKRKPTVIAEIIIVICLKLLVIFGLWYFFFSPSHRPQVTAETVGDAIVGVQAEKTPSHTN